MTLCYILLNPKNSKLHQCCILSLKQFWLSSEFLFFFNFFCWPEGADDYKIQPIRGQNSAKAKTKANLNRGEGSVSEFQAYPCKFRGKKERKEKKREEDICKNPEEGNMWLPSFETEWELKAASTERVHMSTTIYWKTMSADGLEPWMLSSTWVIKPRVSQVAVK